jgi:hypothetical protein
VSLVFLAITLTQTWPLAARLPRVLPNDLGDPMLNTWILWWNAHAIPLTPAWWNAPMFFPTHGAMAFSETLLGLAWIASPVQWLGASPVAAYNLSFLLSFPLSACAAYGLAWSLIRRAAPAFVAGALYGYAMFRFAHLGHIQILWSWWMPLALLGLHQWMRDGRRAGLLLFGVAWLGESLSNGYYFFYFSIIVALWLLWFTRWREARRQLVPVLLTWMAAVACFSPVLLTYARVQQEQRLHRDYGEIAGRGADLFDFFITSEQDRAERNVTLGVVATCALIGCVAISLREARRSPLAFYTLATVVAMVLALGPTPRAGGVQLLASGPYAWLMAIVPGFTGVRVPARFTLVAVLCLAMATALLLARVQDAMPSRRRLVSVAITLIGVIAIIETWPRPPIPLLPLPPLLEPIALTPNTAAVLELPVGEGQEFPAMYRAMFHRRPLVNGYSGYTPASYDVLRICLEEKKSTDCLTSVRRAGSLDILIDRAHDTGGAWELFASQLPDAQFRYQTRQFTVFHLPALPPLASR